MAHEAACSWCMRGVLEVAVLFEGRGCYICDECAELCVEIAREKKSGRKPSEPHTHGMPTSIQEALALLKDAGTRG